MNHAIVIYVQSPDKSAESASMKMIQKGISYLKIIPGTRSLLKTDAYYALRYRLSLSFSKRKNETYTQFLRLPSQFEALTGPVLDFILHDELKPLKIVVFGCSNGAEPYSIASVLKSYHRDINFTIYGYDIERHMLDKAKKMTYSEEELFDNKMITGNFIDSTFVRNGSAFMVKNDIAERVQFSEGDALNPNLREHVGHADIVYAQNFLVHMRPKLAEKAFGNICRILNSRAVLFIDGMDLDLRYRLTLAHNLSPLKYKIDQIHNEARHARGGGWPYIYWGLEPLSVSRKDWQRRYATIFIRDLQTVA